MDILTQVLGTIVLYGVAWFIVSAIIVTAIDKIFFLEGAIFVVASWVYGIMALATIVLVFYNHASLNFG